VMYGIGKQEGMESYCITGHNSNTGPFSSINLI
jgi:hypothetical protein